LEQLSDKYATAGSTDLALTAAGQRYIAEAGTIKVALIANAAPYTYEKNRMVQRIMPSYDNAIGKIAVSDRTLEILKVVLADVIQGTIDVHTKPGEGTPVSIRNTERCRRWTSKAGRCFCVKTSPSTRESLGC